jgi:cell division protein FtsQ
MKSFKWNTIRLILMFALVIFLYSFTGTRNMNRKIKKSEVVFVGEDNNFVKQEAVNKLLIENNNNAQSLTKEGLNLNKIENSINKHPMIEKSEVFVSVDGVLKAVVTQRTPIARVFQGNNSFYIDYQGYKMPISKVSTARVPLISGDINDNNRTKLAEIVKMIFEDEFLKKNIIGIQVLSDQSLIMTNRNFNFQIEFGKMINASSKFKNYKAFFQKVILDGSLAKYKIINLRFTHQVVCTK